MVELGKGATFTSGDDVTPLLVGALVGALVDP
jgi:hypothetical protein